MLKKKIAALSLSLFTLLSIAVISTNTFAAEIKPESLPDEVILEDSEIVPYWVAPGKKTQYPSQGGKWEYGFWNAKYRSYYTVNKCHGSTVISGGRTSRSIDTVAGKTSIAELWAINNPKANPHYYYRVC